MTSAVMSTGSVGIAQTCLRRAAAMQYRAVRMTDLCAVTGVSERRVRDAFYECYGTSPTAYFRIAALREVRRVLQEGRVERGAVTRAAADHGFAHMGRFAAHYREAFGESPSATVARARRDQVDRARPAVAYQRTELAS